MSGPGHAKVQVWCHECQGYVEHVGQLDDTRAVRVTPAMLAEHRREAGHPLRYTTTRRKR